MFHRQNGLKVPGVLGQALGTMRNLKLMRNRTVDSSVLYTMKKLYLLLAVFAASTFSAFAGNYADVSVDELKAAIEKQEVTVIDVNGTKSYKEGHVPTAINFQEHASDLASKLPADKDTLIVAYCGGPKCGAYKKAAMAAKELGYTNVKHMSAGISGWKKSGQPVEKES